MKKINNIIEQKIEDEILIIRVENGIAQMKQVCCLSESGTKIWELLSETEDLTEHDIVSKLSIFYNISCEEIEEDVLTFIKMLKEQKLVY